MEDTINLLIENELINKFNSEKGRFKVSRETEHPCCYNISILDTRDGNCTFCEVRELSDAIYIADSLNKLRTRNGK